VVDRLVTRGFVTSLNDPNDRRRRAVALTDRGHLVTQAAASVATEINAVAVAPLTEEERRTLVELLKKLG
jgi:MarR family transcriptional regulator, lower aerobic nicotinate degradation pathway regulator